MMKVMKKLKIKVPKVDMNTFNPDNMIIDEKWADLYNPKLKNKKTE